MYVFSVEKKFTLTSYGPPKNVLGFGFIIISNLILVFFLTKIKFNIIIKIQTFLVPSWSFKKTLSSSFLEKLLFCLAKTISEKIAAKALLPCALWRRTVLCTRGWSFTGQGSWNASRSSLASKCTVCCDNEVKFLAISERWVKKLGPYLGPRMVVVGAA